jgi:hypothetical protein
LAERIHHQPWSEIPGRTFRRSAIRYSGDRFLFVKLSRDSPESLWQKDILVGRTSRDRIEQFKGPVRNIHCEFVTVTDKSLHRHVNTRKTRSSRLSCSPRDKLFRCEARSGTSFPRQDPEEICKAIGRHSGMKENPPDIPRSRIVVILEGGEAQPPKVIEECLSPRPLE